MNLIFDSKIKGIYKILRLASTKHSRPWWKLSDLHNIYYKYLATRYKKALKRLKMGNLTFKPVISDARTYLKNDTSIYNLIFLDAFTPAKCPCLWSYNFFKNLYERLDNNGMLLTYSTSSAVRSAMREAGFIIGNNIKNNKIIGTVCAKNPELIEHPLSKYDLGLLNTRAGIFYRDENLTEQNEAILARRKDEVDKSSRISTTQYIKSFKKVK